MAEVTLRLRREPEGHAVLFLDDGSGPTAIALVPSRSRNNESWVDMLKRVLQLQLDRVADAFVAQDREVSPVLSPDMGRLAKELDEEAAGKRRDIDLGRRGVSYHIPR